MKLLQPVTISQAGSSILRIMAGLIIFKFGLELFEADKMNGYRDWLTDLGFPAPRLMAVAGKLCELAGGLFLAFGLFTRLAALALLITMSVVVFVMGKPDLLAADGSYLLLLIFLHFFFTGPGTWSFDYLFFTKKQQA